jgi:molecular chaperone HscB
MTSRPIVVRSEPNPTVSVAECRSCGAGAPVDEHFCPSCSRILSLGRHGDYFAFLGLPRRLRIDPQDLERRFRELSRKFHPDYFYNAAPAERLASLERSSYLNDAFRVLRHPVSRIEHLLAIEGLPPARSEGGNATVPPGLLEEVFALNEELDEIRELREGGADAAVLRHRLDAAKAPILARRDEHERRVAELSDRWDQLPDDAAAPARRATLDALRECVLERSYINNLMAAIERETPSVPGGATPAEGGQSDTASAHPSALGDTRRGPRVARRSPAPRSEAEPR